ncbi:hypothetical protein GCM10023350_06010 [Nocardioides endophyticus]|uniref:Uncharacterized protein n=1 Tax=Nocardioides endophyticus TaxID=1353775 RepID=A0ABP8YEX9_9ACTN
MCTGGRVEQVEPTAGPLGQPTCDRKMRKRLIIRAAGLAPVAAPFAATIAGGVAVATGGEGDGPSSHNLTR